MHDLRKHILKKLITKQGQRYTDLKPGRVEGNLFSYHLGAMVRAGLVLKTGSGLYELAPAGKLYADRVSMASLAPRAQPKLVTLLVCRNTYGEYLLYKRKVQPLYGKTGFPYGKIHIGETVAEAARRELREKTGLSGALSHRGDGYIHVSDNRQAISHIMFHLFVGGPELEGELIKQSSSGSNRWEKLYLLDPQDLMPGVLDLARLLEQNPISRFFVELSYDLDPSVPDILEV